MTENSRVMKRPLLRPLASLTFIIYVVGLVPVFGEAASGGGESAPTAFFDGGGAADMNKEEANAKEQIATCQAARGIADELNVAHNSAIQEMPADSAMRTDCTQTAKKIIGLGHNSADQKKVMDKCVANLQKAYAKCEKAFKKGQKSADQTHQTSITPEACKIGLKKEEGESTQKVTALANATTSSHKAADNLTNGNKAIGSVGCVDEKEKGNMNSLLAGLAGAAIGAGVAMALSKKSSSSSSNDDDDDDDDDSESSGSSGDVASYSSAGSIPSTTYTDSSSTSSVTIPDALLSTEITSNSVDGGSTDNTPSVTESPLVIKPADVAATESDIVSGRGTTNSSASSSAFVAATSGSTGGSSGGSGSSGTVSTGSGNGSFIAATDSSGSGGGGGGRSLGSVGRYSDDSDSGGGTAKNTNEAGLNENLLIRPKLAATGRTGVVGAVGGATDGRAAQLERDADCVKNPDAARCKAAQNILRDPLLGGN